MWLEDNSV